MRALDWFIARQSRGRPRPVVRQILRVSLYQALFLDRIPDHAIASEAVRLAAEDAPDSVGIVNAVVRAWLRRRPGLPEELAALQKRSPSVGWSHPGRLYRRWTRRFGETRTVDLCAWNNAPPPLAVRVANRIDPAEAIRRLEPEGIDAVRSPADPRFLRIGSPVATLIRSRAWREGLLYVQDESTILPVDLLDPRPGERILDACAAPGGKTVALAERAGPDGRVVAADVDPQRLERVRENVERMRTAEIVEIRRMDVREPPARPETFDAVLLDAPCTNTGVLRRRPDARWRFDRETLAAAAALQAEILEGAAGRVRPGGRLVYATCSLEPEENGERVAAFLEGHPEFRLVREIAHVPPRPAHDGVYAARLERRDADDA